MPRRALAPLLAAALALAGSARADDMTQAELAAAGKYQHGDFAAAVALLAPETARHEAAGDEARAGFDLFVTADSLRQLGRQPEAVAAAGRSLAHLRAAGDNVIASRVLRSRAMAQLDLHRSTEAAADLREAIALDAALEDADDGAADRRALGDAEVSAGKFDEAARAYEDALAHERDPYKQGSVRIALAFALERLGRHAEAKAAREQGQLQEDQARGKARAEGANEATDAQFNVATRRAALGDPRGAYRAWQAMLFQARKAGFKIGMETALMNLCGLDSSVFNRPEDALKEAEEGWALARPAGDSLNGQSLLMDVGIARANLGRFADGLDALKQAREMAVRRRDVFAEINILTATREVYGTLGDFPKMLWCNEQMLEVARRGASSRALAKAEAEVGSFYDTIGDAQSYLEHAQRELAAARAVGDRDQLLANALNDLAGAQLSADRLDEAEKTYRQSLAIHDWLGGHVNLALVHLAQGRLEDAAAEVRRLNNPDHLLLGQYYLRKRDFSRARVIFSHNVERDARGQDFDVSVGDAIGLALAEENLKDYAAAAAHYGRAARLVERSRDTLSAEHRVYFLGTDAWTFPRLEAYEGLARVSAFLSGGARESLHQAEFTRGRLFAEAAARRYAGAGGSQLPPELAKLEASADAAVSAAGNRLQAALMAHDTAERAALEAALSRAEADRAAVVEKLRKQAPAYAAARYPQPLYAEDFALEPDEYLLEFEVTEPYTKAFVVHGGKVVLSYDVARTRAQLTELVKRYRSFFEGVADTRKLAAFDPRKGYELFSLLARPALAAIPKGAKVTIVPDEILDILPFESLVTAVPARLQMPSGRRGPAPVGVRYLADDFDIAYEQSATAMSVQRRLSRGAFGAWDLFVLADPVFGGEDSRLRETAVAALPAKAALKTMGAIGAAMGLGGRRGGLSSGKTIGGGFLFPRLDQTGLLARALVEKVFAGRKARALTGLDASKGRLAAEELGRFRYLVFATHGVLDDQIPGLREPALVLSQVGPGAGSGFLTMSEVMSLKLNADLVALTACDTGLGKRLTGEGVMGLGRAFQYAGARSVLVSLWSVSEESTTMLAERFFAHLGEGKTKRQALRLARADVRRAGFEHPFFWAPFILIGGAS